MSRFYESTIRLVEDQIDDTFQSVPIARLELGEKTSFFQLTHECHVHEISWIDISEPGILRRQQSLHVP